jgi:hypothetical protein
MLSEWNKFVSKIFKEGRAKDRTYSFKQALSDASERKSEMGGLPSAAHSKSKSHHKMSRKGKSRKMSRGKSKKHGRKSRKHHRKH